MIDASKPEDKRGRRGDDRALREVDTAPRVGLQGESDRGETLADFDIAFLEEVLRDAQAAKPRVDREPEYQTLYTRAVSLYEEIAKKGLENEQAGKESGAAT